MLKSAGIVFGFFVVPFLAAGLDPSSAQTQEDRAPESASSGDEASPDDRLERIRSNMAASLERLDTLERQLAARELDLSEAKTALEAAESGGKEEEIVAAQRSRRLADEAISALRIDIAAERELYDRTAERFQIAREQASLSTEDDSSRAPQEGSSSLSVEQVQMRSQVSQAEQQAALARQQVEALKAEIEILLERQDRIRREADEINQWLDEGRELSLKERQGLTQDRQWLIDEERGLEDRLVELRGMLVVAETTLRIKKEAAQRQAAEYRTWRNQLLVSLGLLVAIVLIILLLRALVARLVKDPDRQYSANRALSILMTLVLLIGLGLILMRQFPNLVTGIGVVLAGVAIALQEVILSFIGFFAIRGARGYRTGDWIRIGDHYGEVVDIGLLVTTLEEVTPIEFQHQQGGTKTGALTWINNSAIYRERMTNYTRGFPYIWCALTYTITYESDWKRAEGLLRDILAQHDEIHTTAELARKRVGEVSSSLAIKVDDTSPRIRVWAADSGLSFRVRFMVHPRRRRALIDTVNREVIDAFMAASDIDFAYNTMRVIPTPATGALGKSDLESDRRSG